MTDNAANPFAKLDAVLSTPENTIELDKAQDTLRELLNLTRQAFRAEEDQNFDLFTDLAIMTATIVAAMSREEMLMVMNGAISVIALSEEGLS